MAGVGPAASRAAHSRAVVGEVAPCDDLVDEPDALGVSGRQIVTEEHQLLRLLRTDEAGQEIGAAAVGDDPAAHEHLDEARALGREHEITGEGDVGADPGCGAVDGSDDRLVAVLERGDQALCADAGAVHGEHRPFGRAFGERVLDRAIDAQVSAGAEGLLPSCGDDDGADRDVGVRVVEVLDDAVALGRRRARCPRRAGSA